MPSHPQTDRAAAHVVLIGLMGSGKSTVGRVVASLLGRPLMDSDRLIEQRTGQTVRQLWQEGGEAAYRPLERDAVIEVLAGSGPDVLAAPAGAVLNPAVSARLGEPEVFVVWLRAEVATLIERIRVGDHRPLLGEDPTATLQTMADERSAGYAALANLVLDVERRDADELASSVVDAVANGSP